MYTYPHLSLFFCLNPVRGEYFTVASHNTLRPLIQLAEDLLLFIGFTLYIKRILTTKEELIQKLKNNFSKENSPTKREGEKSGIPTSTVYDNFGGWNNFLKAAGFPVNQRASAKVVTTECNKCGEEFTHKDVRNRKFCSKDCSNSQINKGQKAKKTTCNRCEETFEYEGYYENKYCSDICRRKARSRDWSNITIGEYFDESDTYMRARINLRKIAKNKVERSEHNMEKRCKICRYNKHVDLCHIKDIQNFNDNATVSEVNSIDNLVYLCPNHHREFDNGEVKI